MRNLTDSIEIDGSSEEIFNVIIKFLSSEDGYKMWSEDHVSCTWIKGRPFEIGSILYVEEYLHGKLHRLKFSDMNIVDNKSIEYKLLFPVSIICPKGSLEIIQSGESCIFKATLTLRLGKLLTKITRKRIDAMKSHMEKEGRTLKSIVESKLEF